MKLVVSVLILAMAAMPCVGFAQDNQDIPASITSPQKLVKWLSSEFNYRMEILDDWRTPQEILYAREGDCEDFAMLASMALTRQGMKNDIIIIHFKDLPQAHAICMWQEENGTYSFISNRELYRSRMGNVRDAIERYYPDWEKIVYITADKKVVKTIKRV